MTSQELTPSPLTSSVDFHPAVSRSQTQSVGPTAPLAVDPKTTVSVKAKAIVNESLLGEQWCDRYQYDEVR